MSLSFRGVGGDLEGAQLVSFPSDRRVRILGTAPPRAIIVPPNLAFLAMMLTFFLFLNFSRESIGYLLWFCTAFFVLTTCLRMAATCTQIHTQMQVQGMLARSVAEGGQLPAGIGLRFGPTADFGVPRNRLQAAVLELEGFQRFHRGLMQVDYSNLGTWDANLPGQGLSPEEISRLPTYPYNCASKKADDVSAQQQSLCGSSGDTAKIEEARVTETSALARVSSSGRLNPNLAHSTLNSEDGHGKEESSALVSTTGILAPTVGALVPTGPAGTALRPHWESQQVQDCSVCLEEFVDGELVRVLPCCHQFHVACIDRWLAQKATCPVCKHELERAEGEGGNFVAIDIPTAEGWYRGPPRSASASG
eukprot:TRINITY_DN27083_c0_g1_i1.p1 TRINITY_DN27083_c0_g1~~TRINITY_DN27083_c0_g1_i1.p1  ORF type:complete len:364 (-),score=33.26 TRINITY_DN27083_c0_g1_i1:55-1146(-)